RLLAILGPEGDVIVSSGDSVDDAAARKRFTSAAGERMQVEHNIEDTIAVVYIGRDRWPFPIPIVRAGDGWHFDTPAGKEELLNRRIGRNELIVISVCRAYVNAQTEFARRFGVYAQSLRSAPGKRDGLYWETTGGDVSPLGPLVASATAEGYHLRE